MFSLGHSKRAPVVELSRGARRSESVAADLGQNYRDLRPLANHVVRIDTVHPLRAQLVEVPTALRKVGFAAILNGRNATAPMA